MTLRLEDSSLVRFLKQRWPVTLAALITLLLVVTGCGPGDRATGWTGMAVVGDKLFTADLQQARAMDATTGETIWTFPVDPEEAGQGVFYAAPVVDPAGRVFVASELTTGGFLSDRQSIVWGLEEETGRALWRFDGATGTYVESGALGDGVFVIGNGDGNIYALEADSGLLLWTFETGHRVWATPLIVADTAYIGAMDRHLYALDLRTGEAIWEFETEGAFGGTPAVIDGTLYIGAFDNVFYAVDAETGTEVWRLEGQDWFWGSPVTHEDTVFAVDVEGRVYALDAATGEPRWQRSLVTAENEPVPVRGGPAFDPDSGQLFVNAESGTLYALDAADGSTNWQSAGDGRGLSDPVVSESIVYQTLILGTHRIRALQVEDGSEVWLFPPAGQVD